MRRVVVAVMALAVFVSCSENGGRATGAPATTGEATTTTPPTFTGAGGERFCELAKVANDELGRLSQAGPTPEATQALFTSAATAVRAMAGVAPAEIGANARTLARAYDDLVAALARVNWQPDRLSAIAAEELSTPEVLLAGDRLQAYERQVCRAP